MQMAKLPSLSIILSKRSGFHPSTAEIVAFFIWHHFYIRTNGGFYLEFYTKDENYQLVQGVVGPRWSLSVTRFNNIAILERFDSADNTVFPIQCHSGIIIAVIHLGTFLLFIPPVHRHCSGCPKNCIEL